MFKKIYLTILIILLMFTGCKKGNSDTTKNDSSNKDVDKKVIIELIDKLGGGKPKEALKLYEAEIMDLEKNKVKLSDYKGKVIFLNLWATWCPPCRTEMPSMEKLYNNFKDKDFIILAVSQGEKLDAVKNFLQKNSHAFPVFIDINNEVAKFYGTGSIPASYLIDKDGFIIARFVGGRDWYSKEAIELINALIK